MQKQGSAIEEKALPDYAGLYDAAYYRSHCGPDAYERSDQWLRFFGGIAESLIRSLKPRRVLDAGCAWGFLVEAFWDRGVEAWGVDVSEYAIAQVRRDIRPQCRVGSLSEPIEGRYDLITCIEVLEHVPEDEGKIAIRNLCAATDTILFSSSPTDFTEPTHVNVRPVIYWLRLFAEQGFAPDLVYDSMFVSPQAFLVRRQDGPHSEESLVLFSEKLRWQREWVAAQQNFHQASERLQQFMDKNVEISKLAADLGKARHQIELTLQEWIAQNTELRRQVSELGEAFVQRDLWQKRTEETAAALAYSRQECETRQKESEVLNWKLASSQSELDQIHASPGWRLILRYRNWMYAIRARRPWFRKYFEPAILWIFRRLGVGSASSARTTGPASPAAPQQASSPGDNRADAANSRESAGAAGGGLYQEWIRQEEPDAAVLAVQRSIAAQFTNRPTISIVTPVYKVPLQIVRELVDSVRNQTYDRWELCLTHAYPEGKDVRDYLVSMARQDERIKVILLDRNEGISGNSDRALTLASGEFIGLLDHDDTLAPFALYEVVRALNEGPSIDFLYSDKDQLEGEGESMRRLSPLFKPKWSPEIMLGANYLTHFCVMRSELVQAVGGWRSDTDGAQDWDLFFRVIARGPNVCHIPKVLYHWRQIATSVAGKGLAAKPYAAEAQLRTLRAYGGEQGWNIDAEVDANGLIRIHWKLPPEQKLSVILIPSGDGAGALSQAERLLASTNHQAVEIVVPAGKDFSSADDRIRILRMPEDTSLPERVRAAVNYSRGEILIFLDEGVSPAGADWLEELAGPLQNNGVGIVGAQLLDAETGRIRHAGIVFTDQGDAEYIFSGEPEHYWGEFGSASWYRNWSAVSGACFSMRRDVWRAVGELSAALRHPRLDVEICLRVQFDAKLRILYNPFARFFQARPAAMEGWLWNGRREAAASFIKACFSDGDPYFNPNLICQGGKVKLRARSAGSPAGASPGTDYAAESRALVSAFDFTEDSVRESQAVCGKPGSRKLERIAWLIPEFTNPFYGGIHTILRFADHFSRQHGVHSTFAVLGHAHPSRIRDRIAAAFPELAAGSEVLVMDSDARINEVPPCDAAIATLWTTAYAALRFQRTRRKFYFLQDYEPLFYPAGSTSALVEATYNFGYFGICNTAPLRDLYVARGGEAEYFDPSIDPRVFHADGRPAGQIRPQQIFCYARPGHPRNSFELVTAALKMVKQRLGDQVAILTAGAEWDPKDYGLEGVLENLGLLGYRTTGALYRACDVGVVMMMTCHPSYLPLELMASGALVVTNRNHYTTWLLKDRENCLLADGGSTNLADRIVEGLNDFKLRTQLCTAARELVSGRYSDWDSQAERVFQCLLNRS